MRVLQSKVGWCVVGLYIATAVYLIYSQGLFGESFIAVILGLPWSWLLLFIGDLYFPPQRSPLYPVVLYLTVLFPMALNAIVLYLIGFWLERRFPNSVGSLRRHLGTNDDPRS